MTHSPLSQGARPLVSVLVRTMGRPSLARALASVAAQLPCELEAVICNAAGVPLGPCDLPSGLAVRWVDPGRPLSRAEAANALLDAAQGRFWLFLDDDDWLLPGHVAKLVDALEADASLVATYADVECIAHAGTPRQRTVNVYQRDFDPAALQLQNFLPIHAVLFRADTADAIPPCRFAPELELFEDWDFWLQLAARGPFRRVPGVSAIYAIDPQAGSGHAVAASAQRREMLQRLGARQLARWRPEQVAQLIEHDVALSTRVRAQDQGLEQLQAETRGLRQTEAELRAAFTRAQESAATLETQLGEMHARAEALDLALAKRSEETQQLAGSLAAVRAEAGELRHGAQLQQDELKKLAEVRLSLLADIGLQQHQLALMRNSWSWKLTRPLRVAKAAARRAAGLARRAARLARNSAGAVRQGVARHGVVGFARRVPYFLRNRDIYLHRLQGVAPTAGAAVFQGQPPELRDIRLHPDLEEARPAIDAKVSVVIPTLNAGAEFGWLLRKLRAQEGVREVELVIVDSGSTDATVALARQAGATVVEIPQSEFSHSHSRNLGAAHATGDYLLFMVQDAYPVGQRWMQGMLAFLQEHAGEKLAAVSCAETSRSDSDMMYDAMINTHYRFLGCLDHDRLGEWRGDDHMALRSQGQLSDVSCLIARELFDRYKYRGNYAEDLDLGIRLIQDGLRVAMLASVKTVHSHNRPAYYYLKRTFVDVIFLVGLFKDFTYPRCESLPGLVAGIAGTGAYINDWLRDEAATVQPGLLSAQIGDWIARARAAFERPRAAAPVSLGEPRLDEFINRIGSQHASSPLDGAARDEARRFADMFLARLEHFNAFAAEVYGEQDALLRREAADVIRKTYAATVGAALAFQNLDSQGEAQSAAIREELVAGV